MPSFGIIALVLSILFVGFIGGALIAVVPWWFFLALLLLPLLAVLGIAFPEIAIVGMLILFCGLVPAPLTPQIRIGPGVLKGHELAAFLLLGISIIKGFAGSGSGPYWRWMRPVMLFMVLAVSASAVGLIIFKSPVKDVMQDARNLVGWTVLFIVVMLVRTSRQFDRLIWGMVCCGTLVAVAVILQYLTGWRLIQDAVVQQLVTLNEGVSDVVRSSAGGGVHLMVFSMLLMLAWSITRSVSLWITMPLLVLLIMGIVVTFGRGIWIATFLASLILSYLLLRWRGVAVFLLIATSCIAIGLVALTAYKPRTVEAAISRAISAGQESLDPNTTLGWRAEETYFAFKRILASPVVGIGFGTPYKPLIRMNGRTETEQDEFLTRYIHNAYIGLWLKLGFLGLVAAIWLTWEMFARGRAMMAQASDVRSRGMIATVLCTFMVLVIISFTQPEWLSQAGIAFMGLMLACLICLDRTSDKNALATGKVSVLRRFARPWSPGY